MYISQRFGSGFDWRSKAGVDWKREARGVARISVHAEPTPEIRPASLSPPRGGNELFVRLWSPTPLFALNTEAEWQILYTPHIPRVQR